MGIGGGAYSPYGEEQRWLEQYGLIVNKDNHAVVANNIYKSVFLKYSLEFILNRCYYIGMWRIDRTDEVAAWIAELDNDAKEAIYKNLLILKDIGPSLGRPYVDAIKASKHKNMKELRVNNKKRVFRIFFVFDPKRNAILLIGGDKRGDKRFYQRMIPIAEKLYDRYLQEMQEAENEYKE